MRVFYLICSLFLFIPSAASAATYYVNGSVGNDLGTGSSASPKKYIKSGLALMQGGDTLIIADGTYTGSDNQIRYVPSGSAGARTVIRAQNDFMVTLRDIGTGYGGFHVWLEPGRDYIDIIGINAWGEPGNSFWIEGNYNRVMRSSCDGAGGNTGCFGSTGQYNLFEDCHSWGQGRYPFGVFQPATHTVFRRCVVRWDFSNTDQPQACFANYDTSSVAFQNCIAIDGKDVRGQDVVYDGLKGFFTPNGAVDTVFEGCIALNLEGGGYYIEDRPITGVTVKNSVAWDSRDAGQKDSEGYDAWLFYSRYQDSASDWLLVDHCTFGKSDYGEGIIQYEALNSTLRNSIAAQITLGSGMYALESWQADNDICFFGNTGSRNGGSGSRNFEYDAIAGGALKYLTRIEQGSRLDGAASDGGDIGATILNRIGVSGTCWGQAGWDTVTSEPLWPFPYEDTIRSNVRTFYASSGALFSGSPVVDGKRGFAADGQTLTRYIWEYLGNPIPPEIYAGSPAALSVDTTSLPDGMAGIPYNQTLIASGGTQPYAWSISSGSLPAGLILNASTAQISGTPSAAGTFTFAARVTDALSVSSTRNLTVVVAIYNNAPALASIGAKSVAAGSNLQFTVSAADPDGDALTYSASSLPSGASFANRLFSWAPTSAQVDMYPITFTVSDGKGGIDSEVVTITVLSSAVPNSAPLLAAIGPKTASAGEALQITASATDADADTLSYSASPLPAGATFSGGSFNWTPNSTQTGTHTVTFSVSDGRGGTDSETVTITVQASSGGGSPADTTPPAIQNMNPRSGEVQVPRYTSVMFHLTDASSGVDQQSIRMTVHREGDKTAALIIDGGVCVVAGAASCATVGGTPADYAVSYTPPGTSSYRFNYDQEITVSVNASDKAGNDLAYTYTFTTAVIDRSRSKKIR